MAGDAFNSHSSLNSPSDSAARLRDPSSPRHVSCDIDAPSAQPRVMNPVPSTMDRLSREDDASTLISTPSSDIFSSDDRSTSASTNMASDIDRQLHDVGFAALAAVSHFPHAVNDYSGSFLVSELVNAVTSGGSPPDVHLLGQGGPLLPGRSFYYDQSESRTPAGPDFDFGHGFLSGREVNPDATSQSSIHRTAGWQDVSLAQDSAFESQRGQVLDPDSSMETNPSIYSESQDEFEDFIRFYPDEEEHHNLRKQRPTQLDAEMADIDLDDFYKAMNYEDIDVELPQSLGVTVSDTTENHVAEQPGAEPHPASVIHTSSELHAGIWQSFTNISYS